MEKGGNDYTLGIIIENLSMGVAHHVKDYNDTWHILNTRKVKVND